MAEREQPKFRLIVGGNQKPARWLSPPATAIGRSPFDKNRIMAYRLTTGDLQKHLDARQRQPILDLWWHVHGLVPPISGAAKFDTADSRGTRGLGGAHACFRGLMRPAGEDDRGFDYVAFVTKPAIGLKYEPSMGCLIKKFDMPADLVFVIYARLDFPEGRRHNQMDGKPPVTEGVIVLWQLVECDPENPMLPIDHKSRFRRRLW
ncbi:hypothetical protein EOD10_35875 [Mesorhizobium sp. M7A.T.Ca.TU.009.01.3.2]|nr:hypothetical protein EOD10_35875 [Mesorhizobium sp. M7A.T.Ca.TU.009.01.3.2]RUV10866.1 hypothetical protein EOD00_11315 [Mesorhizobium sp. M7A.T.Ca.TU.009.01.3.1]